MSSPDPDYSDSDTLRSVIEHVFMPPKLPQKDPGERIERETNVALCNNLTEAAQKFFDILPLSERPLWTHMIKMIELARRAATVRFEEVDLQQALSNMDLGDVFSLHVRAQNAALIVRRLATADFVQFEVFEVSPQNTAIMTTEGKLLCSYPGLAIQVPVDLSSFLVQMDAGSVVYEVRESVHPRYISEGYGQPSNVNRITKRIGDDVLFFNALKPWRRSPLWLTLRLFMLYFHAHLLRSCVDRDFPSELLYSMRLGPVVSHHETERLLSKRWTDFQTIGSIGPTFQVERLDFVADTHITLENSYDYLMKMVRPASHGFSHTRFNPSHELRVKDVDDFTLLAYGRLAKVIYKDQRIAIADFELLVQRDLVSWVAASISNGDALDVIASCIQQYYDGAKDLYGANSEDNSIMILTIMDLWVALDTLAIQQCPLLKQYSPEIPFDFLHCLLLHRSSTVKRALQIENHLRRRHNEASLASVFSNDFGTSCFAVKYYRTSEELKRLYHKIDAHAQQERAEKLAELAALNEESKSLRGEASKLPHEQSRNRWGYETHSTTCRRCQLERRANALKIHIHEWPLPTSMAHAQLAVFELSPPRAFSTWRDITYMILHDIPPSSIPDSSVGPKIILARFSGLRPWADTRHRVTIGSTTKSFSDQSHYKNVQIPADDSSVLVNNGLSFQLCDRINQSWVGPLSMSSVAELCTPPIPPSGPYNRLHHFVSGTQHTPNEIIAAQGDCPKEISLHEFLAFSSLRSCPRLQWLNIARELASPSLSLRCEEVHTLVTQAAWQLGPLSDGVREWHVDLSVFSFGKALLRELEALLEKIKANWLEEVTVRTIALIISRLLASTTDLDISVQACALLREARKVTYQWIREIIDSTECETSRHRLFMLAATCFSTFDVSPEHLHTNLSSDEDFSIAIHCAVVVYDNTPPSLSYESSFYLARILSRHRRLLHDLEPVFGQSLPAVRDEAKLLRSRGYDQALSQMWPGDHQCIPSSWYALPRPNSRWIFCVAKGGQKVHYNLLSGQLLIGGRRLGKLPQEIMEHSTYTSVLGSRILNVIPADKPGVEFMTRSTVSGYQDHPKILFSWIDGNLILQARKAGDSQIFQLIPRSTLFHDFPRYLVDNHVHWLDLSTGELEFRPVGSPWTPDPSNWRLYVDKPGIYSRTVLQKPGRDGCPIQLIDMRSDTFAMVSSLLSPLISPDDIIVTRTTQTLEVSLPRLHVAFFVNTNSELECRSIPGYVIDKNQSCGTMFGLTTKLILRPSFNGSEMSPQPRRVIIPQGEVLFRTNGDFTNVSINTDAQVHIPWHEYLIDTDLGCITSNTGLRSKLYQCYLHALTSHCLPDPLLCHTGTEEALHILRSAACRSFQRLGVYEAKLLELISNLTPDRVYYPRHRQSMATVKWNDLPALAQHHDFCQIVSSILDHARALEALYDQPAIFDTFDFNQSLLNRAASRNMSYYPSDLQVSERPSSLDDVEYRSRDVSDDLTSEDVVYKTSWMLWNAQPSLDRKLPMLWDVINSWGSLGPTVGRISRRYSRYWLEFDAARDWFMIYDLCRTAVFGNVRNSRIELSFSLSAAAYSKSKYSDIVPVLIIFALDERCRNLSPPPDPSFKLSDGLTHRIEHLEGLILKSALPIHQTPAHVTGKKAKRKKQARIAEYESVIRRQSSLVAESISDRWSDLRYVDFCGQWFDEPDCKQRVEEYIQSISRNLLLRDHVLQLQTILQQHWDVSIPAAVPYVFTPQFTTRNRKSPSHTIRDVLISRTKTKSLLNDRLQVLIEEFQKSPQPLLRLYGNELNNSHFALLRQNPSRLNARYPSFCSRNRDKAFCEISAALAPSQYLEKICGIAGLWPRITPRSILRQLARDCLSTLCDQWKLAITRYAIDLLKCRQSRRLLELSSRQRHDELLREIEESTPDWLLIQIEADFLARPVQVDVAHKMISPCSKRNTSLQLNMGEGKSSVIVPLIVSTLADGSNLVRVVTLKPLSNQMFQLLVSRLSGLANRPVFYCPFSRSLRMSSSLVRTISGLYKRCVAEGGVLVVQPEHILSQKLMHVDTLLTSQEDRDQRSEAHGLEALQQWVTKVSFTVRYQLIYTAGEQMPVDDHPNRWLTIQQVFSRLKMHATERRPSARGIVEIEGKPREFPRIRILDSAKFQELSSLIINDALEGRLTNLRLGVLPSQIRQAARRFIGKREVETTLLKGILLLRGLLTDSEGILGYVLRERRWRVDYGLDYRRTLLAVPYRAKDVPSLRADFAHPDVAITLTCLSYYYGGLTKDQVLSCFDLLAKLDNPETEYDHWVELEQTQDFPATLRQLSGVNTEDEAQVDLFLVPLFSKNKRVVDFYLSQVVFPRCAREFPNKLSTSAWDLAEEKENVTTGFSGTNDNRHLSPTGITQVDPDFVLCTNALVLQHLLRSENDCYQCTDGVCAEEGNGESQFAKGFLKLLVKQVPEIRVLLDVGAQILELGNEELAREWLSLRPDVAAAIFFNDSHHLTVVTQDGTIEPFISSPFNKQLDKCVTYLDDAHTRGTDLKLPLDMRAAVTLGPKVTKDRLVQGCMRMRQLGKGHSVMFFAPGEVDRRIRSLVPKGMSAGDRIRVPDILRWAMHESCEDIRHHLPYWVQQGVDHHGRFAAYKDRRSAGGLEALREAWLQPESRTLEEMYLIAPGTGMSSEICRVPSLQERMERLGFTKLVDVRIAEEQEREVDHEIEQERQVERPPKVKPAQHIVGPVIREFVKTGKLSRASGYILSPVSKYIRSLLSPVDMASALDSTSEWSPSPLTTTDFTITVLGSSGELLTDYLRPVNWILSSGSGKDSIVIVISPYEAHELLPIIRKSKKVRLHVYAPRVTFSMRSFSDLTFHSISDSPNPWSAPAHLRTELNLFAGQLYLDSKEEYERVCVLLALFMAHPGAEFTEVDGFVLPAYRTGENSPFKQSKISILKELISLRRKGMGYHRTHLGQILNANPLSKETLSVMSP
ncbi:hypothetical protein F5148DRAFT_1274598 [Russula earlei]|uniref:Uncharacterized protein n=1 Tax=Russula earlei TaxID=71964 RepID=A0ACC0UI28_9AGAM|nr:hypothetical protein F5148DRAFT_1274598 [Russula earlei]